MAIASRVNYMKYLELVKFAISVQTIGDSFLCFPEAELKFLKMTGHLVFAGRPCSVALKDGIGVSGNHKEK